MWEFPSPVTLSIEWGGRRISPACFISAPLFLSLSLFLASDGSVFQSDGENRQGEEDVVSDTVHVTGRYRPEIGECVFYFQFLMFKLWLSMNLAMGVYVIEHSDLLKSDGGYSCQILQN